MKSSTRSSKLQAIRFAKVIVFWIGSMVLLIASSAMVKPLTDSSEPLAAVGLAMGGTLLLTYLFTRWDRVSFEEIGMRGSAKHFLLGWVVGTILVAIQFSVIWLSGRVVVTVNEVTASSIILSFVFYLLIALREEIVFRGFILRRTEAAFGPWLAILLTTVLFIVEHRMGGMTWRQALIGPGIGAVLFAAAALCSRSIALPTGIHAAWNFVQWMLGFKEIKGLLTVDSDPAVKAAVEQTGYYGYWAAMAIGLAFCVFAFRKSAGRKNNKG